MRFHDVEKHEEKNVFTISEILIDYTQITKECNIATYCWRMFYKTIMNILMLY